MNSLSRIDDLLEDNERASTLLARDIVLNALSTGPSSPELDEAILAVARGLYETAESHDEGVEALRFALTYHSPKAAAELLADLDGADAVQRIHLIMMAEDTDNAFAAVHAAVHAALPKDASVRRRLGKELKQGTGYKTC